MELRTGDEAAMGLEQDGNHSATLTKAAPARQKAAVSMDKADKGSEELVAEKAGEAMAEAIKAAAKPMHGAVSRLAGSPTKFSFGNIGNCSAIGSTSTRLVTINCRSNGTKPARRSLVDWIIVRSPDNANSCLGRIFRLAGQNRVPLPPAMITACSILSLLDSCDETFS